MEGSMMRQFFHGGQGMEHVKAVCDGISIGVVLTTLVGWLPALAALVSIIWGCLRIYEWFENRGKK
jgi:hypothetical protein